MFRQTGHFEVGWYWTYAVTKHKENNLQINWGNQSLIDLLMAFDFCLSSRHSILSIDEFLHNARRVPDNIHRQVADFDAWWEGSELLDKRAGLTRQFHDIRLDSSRVKHRDIVTELLFGYVEPIADTRKFQFFVSPIVCDSNRKVGNCSLCRPWNVRKEFRDFRYLVEKRGLKYWVFAENLVDKVFWWVCDFLLVAKLCGASDSGY